MTRPSSRASRTICTMCGCERPAASPMSRYVSPVSYPPVQLGQPLELGLFNTGSLVLSPPRLGAQVSTKAGTLNPRAHLAGE